ncbi:sensor histidine kinase [Tenacibaculum sp. 190130A14a]|uniref:sensor histidine kinase n=1 Tax=Tenacibaculum polynesiense TaxID=3137857 RepID=UPI0032B1BE33
MPFKGNAQDNYVLNNLDSLIKKKNYQSSLELIKLHLKNEKSNFNFRNNIYIKEYLVNLKLKKKDSAYNTLLNAKKKYKALTSKEKAKLTYYLAHIHQIHTRRYDSVIFYSLKSLSKLQKNNEIYDKFTAMNYKLLSRAYSNLEKDSLEIYYLKKRLKSYKKISDIKNIVYSLNNIGTFYSNTNSNYFNIDSSSFYYREGLSYQLNHKISGTIFQNLAAIHLEHYKNYDSTLYFTNKALSYKLSPNSLASLYFNKASINIKRKDTHNAVKNYKISKKYAQNSGGIRLLMFIEENLFNIYINKKEYQKAIFHRKLYEKFKDSIHTLDVLKNLNDIEAKYKTAEKEKAIAQQKEQIAISEAKRIQNQNFLYGSLAIIFLGTIIAYLNLKNSRKKRLLAEQQKELVKQKNLTLLKEQEINTINAMIDGQEKERVRIAEDLHDNIGSVLATLKLHFENLKLNREKKHFNQEELYNKTEKLIDETYLKVRSIAHAKNAGVIANKGLLIAVKLMAEKISAANKIKIDVLDFGLDKRLENSLEISIFRIIQELTTNIIKHANATQATINISQFDQNLNIIIEDNGNGFDIHSIKQKNGMGLHSIQTRIQYLEGTFEVDSTIGKGTSIIVDIPIVNT